MSAWTTSESDALERCGHCDNCIRPPTALERKDVSFAVWQILKITAEVQREGGNLTQTMLGNLARGVGGGGYEVTTGRGKRKEKEKVVLDLDSVCGGKVDLKKEVRHSCRWLLRSNARFFLLQEIDHLVVQLLLDKYLSERYHSTAYATVVYMQLGPLALRFTRLSLESVKTDPPVPYEFTFQKKEKETKGKEKEKTTKSAGSKKSATTGEKRKKALAGKTKPAKRQRVETSVNEIDEDEEDDEIIIVEDDDDDEEVENEGHFDDDDETYEAGWSHTLRSSKSKEKAVVVGDDIMVLSD